MSVGNRINEALEKLQKKDYENSLIQICIALDATSKKEYPNLGPSKRYKKFIKDNMGFITKVAFAKLEIQSTPKFMLSDGTAHELQDILYKILRCTLLHEGKLNKLIIIVEQNQIGSSPSGMFIFSVNLITSLLFLVIGSEMNKDAVVKGSHSFNLGNRTIHLSEVLGRKQQIYNMVKQANT